MGAAASKKESRATANSRALENVSKDLEGVKFMGLGLTLVDNPLKSSPTIGLRCELLISGRLVLCTSGDTLSDHHRTFWHTGWLASGM